MAQCIDPSELEEGMLTTFIDGEADERERTLVQAHLDRCQHCAGKMAEYRRTLAQLHVRLYRRSCPAPEKLGLYQLNLLPADERLIIARHVRECPHCRRELDELAQVDDRPSLLERLRRAVGVIEAVLVPLPPQMAFLRGPSTAPQRFRTDKLDLQISQQPGYTPGKRTIMGRVMPREAVPSLPLGAEAWLMQAGEQEEEALAVAIEVATGAEAGGVFTFEDVTPGTYTLGLEWDGQAVRAQGIVVT